MKPFSTAPPAPTHHDGLPPDGGTVVAVAVPGGAPGLYDYQLSPQTPRATQVGPGVRVRVDFRNRSRIALVQRVGSAGGGDGGESARPLLQINEVIDDQPIVDAPQMRLVEFAARYYHHPIGEVWASALPAPLLAGAPWPERPRDGVRLTDAGLQARGSLRRGSRPAELVDRLADAGVVDRQTLTSSVPGAGAALSSLIRRGYVERCEAPIAAGALILGPMLNPAQAEAVDVLAAAAAGGGSHRFLLDGVTGSGKTEVYLHAAARALDAGGQVLVLVPEIGLVAQTLARFEARFPGLCGSFHSALSERVRHLVYQDCRTRRLRVVVGTRSSVFLPLPGLALAIVDEEHDLSYKQQDGLRYHARDLASFRTHDAGVTLLVGSATPSLETLHAVRDDRMTRLRLPRRAGVARPPEVRIVDLRQRRSYDGLDHDSLDAIRTTVDNNEQVLVFRNRRGYAPVLECQDCGFVARCNQCDVTMTVHASGRRLECHHCGARRRTPLACPDCASLALAPMGVGTQRLEESLAASFPAIQVIRIDQETIRGRDGLARALRQLGQGAGILVGTQMLAKGHDLPGLSLAVLVGIDAALAAIDPRGPERAAQMLVQVAGRVGRSERPGLVLVQTRQPHHPLLQQLLGGGYGPFAESELELREAARLPPFVAWSLLRVDAADLEGARTLATRLAAVIKTAAPRLGVAGPAPAPLPRRAGRQRLQILLSAPSRGLMQAELRGATEALSRIRSSAKARWSLDVDPLDFA